jgi:hypothetical protein
MMVAQVIDFMAKKEERMKFDMTAEFLTMVMGATPSVEQVKTLVKEIEAKQAAEEAAEMEAKKAAEEEEARHYGNKYDGSLDIKEIAKLVRQDIKKAVKAGELPNGLKTSVKISRYTGGQSLRVTVKAGITDIYTQDYVDGHNYGSAYTEEALQVKKVLAEIVEAYNFDKSDIMTDYFHVNFYGFVEFDHNLTEADYNSKKGK